MGSSGSFSANAGTSIKFRSSTKNTKEEIEEVLRLNVKIQVPIEEDDEDYDEYDKEANWRSILATPKDFIGYDLKRVIRGYKEAPDYMQGLKFVANFGDVWGDIYYENDNSDSSNMNKKDKEDLIKHINSGLITLEEVLDNFELNADGNTD